MYLVCRPGIGCGIDGVREVPEDLKVGSVVTIDGHVWSCVSTCPKEIPGVLLLAQEKTYGSSKNGKLLYMFRPADSKFPPFYVPYRDGKQTFSKHREDKYGVVYGFPKLQLVDNRLTSVLVETFGDVSDAQSRDEYLLAKNELRYSNKQIQKIVRTVTFCKSTSDQIDNVFTIDPDGCRDYDDAFSVEESNEWDGWRITVHISNVALTLGTVGLLKHMGSLMQSVYLATQTRGMLPPVLANGEISLTAGTGTKRTLAFEFRVCRSGSCEFIGAREGSCEVIANYVYGSSDMHASEMYQMFKAATAVASGNTNILDSHDEVAWWMVRYNAEAGAILHRKKQGIFRVCRNVEQPIKTALHDLGLIEIAEWESEYRGWEENVMHGALECATYAQASSPIRRRCDLINQILLLSILGHSLNDDMSRFCAANSCVNAIDTMNIHSRSAKKAERSSFLAKACRDIASAGRSVKGVCIKVDGPDSKGGIINQFYLRELRLCVYSKSVHRAVVGNEYVVTLYRKDRCYGESDDYAFEITHG